MFENFAHEGLPFRSINTQATFSHGNMDLTGFRLESNVMDMDAQGRINLLEEQMDVRASLKPLGVVSAAVGMVPLVGKVAASLTEIHFTLSGSLDDPRVLIIPGQGVAGAVEDQAKGMTGFFSMEENKWIRKRGKPEP